MQHSTGDNTGDNTGGSTVSAALEVLLLAPPQLLPPPPAAIENACVALADACAAATPAAAAVRARLHAAAVLRVLASHMRQLVALLRAPGMVDVEPAAGTTAAASASASACASADAPPSAAARSSDMALLSAARAAVRLARNACAHHAGNQIAAAEAGTMAAAIDFLSYLGTQLDDSTWGAGTLPEAGNAAGHLGGGAAWQQYVTGSGSTVAVAEITLGCDCRCLT